MKLCLIVSSLLLAIACNRSPGSEEHNLNVTVLEETDGSVKPYEGNVRYALSVVCDGASEDVIAADVLGTSTLMMSWTPIAECAHGSARLKYAVMVNWMRCDSASGEIPIGTTTSISVTVNCDAP